MSAQKIGKIQKVVGLAHKALPETKDTLPGGTGSSMSQGKIIKKNPPATTDSNRFNKRPGIL